MTVVARGRLNATDRAVLAYDLATLALLLAAGRELPSWPWRAALHLLLVPAVWLLARTGRRLHLIYPLPLLIGFYAEAGALRHAIVPHDLDPLVAAWDAALFPGRIYATLPPLLPTWALELLHGVYFSYYLLLLAPLLALRRRATAGVAAYVALLTFCMLAHYAFSLLFPVSGPLAVRRDVMPEGFLFLPLMERIYAAFDHGGVAFPSTHAAAAVIAGAFTARLFPRLRWPVAALVVAILVSTVLCAYHYPLDTAAGVLTGGLFLAASRLSSAGGGGKPAPP